MTTYDTSKGEEVTALKLAWCIDMLGRSKARGIELLYDSHGEIVSVVKVLEELAAGRPSCGEGSSESLPETLVNKLLSVAVWIRSLKGFADTIIQSAAETCELAASSIDCDVDLPLNHREHKILEDAWIALPEWARQEGIRADRSHDQHALPFAIAALAAPPAIEPAQGAAADVERCPCGFPMPCSTTVPVTFCSAQPQATATTSKEPKL